MYVTFATVLYPGYVPAVVKHLYFVHEGSSVLRSESLSDPVSTSLVGEEVGYQMLCRISPISSVRKVVTPGTFKLPSANLLLEPGVYSIGGFNMEYFRVSRSGVCGVGIPPDLEVLVQQYALDAMVVKRWVAPYVSLGVSTPTQPWS